MKLANKIFWISGAVTTCYCCLIFYRIGLHPDSRQKDPKQNEASATHASELPPNGKSVESTQLVAEEVPQNQLKPGDFSGVQLLSMLGSPLSSSTLEVLRGVGDLPEMQAAALDSRGKCYVLGIHDQRVLSVFLGKDNTLLAFGFASSAVEAPSNEERTLLAEFVLSGQPTVTVLDERFEPYDMQIQTYESKMFPKKHALLYSRGRSRTLAFFDTTRVDMKKLLPASPDTMDPATLKQLRSLVDPAK